MALTSLVADAAGDSGASASAAVVAGFIGVFLTNSTDLTSVAIGVEFSTDDFATETVRLQANPATLTNGEPLFVGFVPTGNIRVNITGGGAGDDVDVGYFVMPIGVPAGADFAADIAAIKSDSAAILVDTGTTLDAALAVVDSNVDAILADTAVIGSPAGASIAADIAAVDTNNSAGTVLLLMRRVHAQMAALVNGLRRFK